MILLGEVFAQNYPQVTVCRRGLVKLIPDNSTVRDSIYFPTYWNMILDVNVIIDTVVHNWTSDLRFYLRHRGRGARLINWVGGSGDNFLNTVLDDSAAITINQGIPPYSGRYRLSPPDSLRVFQGPDNDASGYWTLSITDSAPGDTGYLRSWCIQLMGFEYLGIKRLQGEVPDKYVLLQNYPNPFNPTTKIHFKIPPNEAGFVDVLMRIYDILGREIQTLVNEKLAPGSYEVEFDGTDYTSGVYYYSLRSGDYADTKKMVLIK